MSNFINKLWGSILIWIAATFLFGLIRMYGVDDLLLYDKALEFSWTRFVLQMLIMGLSVAIPFAILDYFLDNEWIRKRSYWGIILLNGSLQVFLALGSVLAVGYVTQNILNKDLPVENAINLGYLLSSETSILWIVYSMIINYMIYFLKVVKSKIGDRILVNLLLGKYHYPREESRIFMFLDMKDSTTHGENLGHIRFSALIQDCFNDLTRAIISHNVEVYQYVGDEAVLTWKLEDGFKDANCLKVYFTYMDSLKKRYQYYREKYQLEPFFKAGVHVGPVTVSEVGAIKREIAYHSDVLNTAARIQGMCNQFDSGLLISEEVKNRVDAPGDLAIEIIGGINLKGKQLPVDIFKVEDSA